MQRAEILDREARINRLAGLAGLLGVAFFIAGIVIRQIGLDVVDNDADRLAQFADHSQRLLIAEILTSIGFALFSLPLFALFRAAQARAAGRIKAPLVAFAFIGPVLFAGQGVVLGFGIDEIAGQFAEKAPAVERQAEAEATANEKPPAEEEAAAKEKAAGKEEAAAKEEEAAKEEAKSPEEAREDAREKLADDLIDDSGTIRTGATLRFPAILGLVIGLFYVSLWGLRTGLLTRFWGTFGMALAFGIILLPFALIGVVFWFLAVGLLLIGAWPRGRPPAWETGEAIPWSKFGEEPEDGPRDGPPGDGKTVEGSGREVSEPPLPETGRPPEPGQPTPGETGQSEPGQAGQGQPGQDPPGSGFGAETQGQRRKKRKRRD